VTKARANLALSFLAAAAVHGGVLAWVFAQPAPKVRRAPRPPTTVRLVARTPPPAPAPAPTPPPPPGRAKETPTPRAVARAEPRPAPPANEPAAAPPAPQPQPPRRFAVSMDAVVPGGSGGVAVPTTEGRTAARGDPTLPSSAPVGDNAAAPPPADVTEVERAPRALRQPSAEEIRALYPERAREERLEQDVRVDLLVSERGAVVQVRIRSGGGNGFEDAAAQVARRIAFEPATRAGRPVPVWIPWTVKFRLDG